MSNFVRLSKAGLCLLLLVSLATPVFACSETPFLDQSAAQMIESTVDRIVMNELMSRGLGAPCIETAERALCIDPNTPPEVMDELLRSLPTWIDPEDDRYNRDGRWSSTASGFSGILGDPIILTYSFVPDGTWIPGEGQASTLYATLNADFGGDTAAWKQIFADCFGRWAEFIGITYIEETDDGGGYPNSVGVLGVRGDVRVASANIDGSSNVLAYNWYPAYGGDMVIDSSENWGNSSNDYRFFRNVVMHEHGHGHGLGHVTASNQQLMEAFYQSGFYGPQDDDIRGGMRNYGDYLEKNSSAGEATDWGTIGEGYFLQENVSLTASADSDYYKFTFASGMEVNFAMQYVGSSYDIGDDAFVPINTTQIMDLGYEIRDAAGTTVILTVNDGGYGVPEFLNNYDMDAGTYHVRVRRYAGNDTQRYRFSMNTTINDLTAVDGSAPATGLGLSVYPTPFNPKTTARFYVQDAGPVKLDVYNVQGRVVKSFDLEAAGSDWITVDWNGRDDSGNSVPSGLYFLNAASGHQSETVRALLLK
jgi:hypothetical protein